MTPTSYVYFIQGMPDTPIKIGVSANPPKRLLELQPGNPEELRLIGVIPDAGYRLEADLHNKFRYSRLSGEWFDPSDELLSYIKAQAIRWGSRAPVPWVMVPPGGNFYQPHYGEEVFTLAQVAAMTGWSERSIQRDCVADRYGYARCGERFGMTRQQVNDYIAAHAVPARTPSPAPTT